jgi:hypothetical protein
VAAEAMTDEHDLLDAARNGDQDKTPPPGWCARACPSLGAYCHRMLRPHFAQDTERWISGPARISTSEATDLASQRGATK